MMAVALILIVAVLGTCVFLTLAAEDDPYENADMSREGLRAALKEHEERVRVAHEEATQQRAAINEGTLSALKDRL